MTEPILQVGNVSFGYDAAPILHGVSFEARRGELFIIIGPNGSGKTTLLRLLAGLQTGFNGRVDLCGRDLTRYSQRDLARRTAFVPQVLPPDFPFRVRQVVLMGRSPHLGLLAIEGPEDLAIADEALEFTGVAQLAGRRIAELSGGERQRVFIARAICQQPRLLLLDEPTAALDLAHQVRIMDLMARLQEQKGTTVVMVSHDVNLAAMYADRLLLFKDGRVVRTGCPREVLEQTALEQAYGCRLLVEPSPLGNFPRVTPVPHKAAASPDRRSGTAVHPFAETSRSPGESSHPRRPATRYKR